MNYFVLWEEKKKKEGRRKRKREREESWSHQVVSSEGVEENKGEKEKGENNNFFLKMLDKDTIGHMSTHDWPIQLENSLIAKRPLRYF